MAQAKELCKIIEKCPGDCLEVTVAEKLKYWLAFHLNVSISTFARSHIIISRVCVLGLLEHKVD